MKTMTPLKKGCWRGISASHSLLHHLGSKTPSSITYRYIHSVKDPPVRAFMHYTEALRDLDELVSGTTHRHEL